MNTIPSTVNPFRKMTAKPVDRVITVLSLLLFALFWVDSRQAAESLLFMGTSMLHIAPFLLLAVGVAAYAKASSADQWIARAISGSTGAAVAVGAIAGALSPFCSCGVVPLIAAMLASGVPLAPVMAFCIASPIMDPEMFILTAAGISFDFAVAETAAAIGMGVLAGVSVLVLQRMGHLRRPLRKTGGCGCGTTAPAPPSPSTISWGFWGVPERRRVFLEQAAGSVFFLGKWMALAFFAESLMIAYLPAESVAAVMGVGNAAAIPAAAVIGVPLYMNGYAAIPMLSGFMALGMTPGAALAFAAAGAVSSIPAAMAVYAIVNRSVFIFYIAMGLIGAMAAGYVYQVYHLL